MRWNRSYGRTNLPRETLNLPPPRPPEIQVIHLTPKGDSIHDDVLRAIDRAIPFPLIFEIHHGAQVEPAAAYKRPSEAEAGKWVIHDSPARAPYHPAARPCLSQ